MTKYENELIKNNIKVIVGLDEAGRGPIAGPVVASACIIDFNKDIDYINDSKKLTPKKRLEAYNNIIKNHKYSIGVVSVEEIDKINILEATKLAMIRAVENLNIKVDHLLIDALNINLDIPQTNIIKGDLKSVSIAAASIIAKVTRDKIMEEYHKKYPNYNFIKHKGYLTKEHRSNLETYGPSLIHRKTFEPVRTMVKSGN